MSKLTYVLLALAAALLWLAPALPAAETQPQPWWEREQIRFFWGPWWKFPGREAAAQAAADAGATVFVGWRGWPTRNTVGLRKPGQTPKRAQLAREHGMRFFATMQYDMFMRPAAKRIGARPAVNRKGLTPEESPRAGGRYVACPVNEELINEWLVKYAVDMAESGVVDGLHMDWELGVPDFSGLGDQLCYCDECWSSYAKENELNEQLPRADRYDRLARSGQLRDYLTHLRDRLTDVYRHAAERVRAIKPDFVFSAYDGFMPGHLESSVLIEGMARGLNSPAAPFFIVHAMHYWPNHTAPWWDTGCIAARELGMKFILGSWVGGIMGGMPEMDVSAAQWIYDAAITQDGYWIWFERMWGPKDHSIYRTADRRIRATELKVGEFLRDGTRDRTFATLVEQSGDPALGRNTLSRTLHLADRHLVHVHNVNTDHAVSVLVRLPRLEPDRGWAVGDALTDLRYTHEGSAVWQSRDLQRGVLITMEKRSEAWLLVEPGEGAPDADAAHLVAGDRIRAHPDSPAAGAALPAGKPAAGDFPLVFSRTGPLGYYGQHQPILGNSIFAVDAAAGIDAEARQLFATKGDCWSPRLSPDRARVVFSAYVNGRGQVHAVSADATVLTGVRGKEKVSKPYWATETGYTGTFEFKAAGINLSNNEHCEHSPVWSPDGSGIAFVSDRDGDWEIYVMNADGTEQRRLTRAPGIDRAPAWSPDGARIAFESNRSGEFDIFVIAGDGSGERVLIERSGQDLEPCWSPDGGRIAFIGNQYGYYRDIMVIDPATGATEHPKGLTHAAGGHWRYTNVHSICWSPDGKAIAGAFEKNMQRGSGIFVVQAGLREAAGQGVEEGFVQPHEDAGSGEGVELTELVTAAPFKPRPGDYSMRPTRHLMVGGWYFGGDASNRFIVRTFEDLAWSADGRALAFRSDMDPSGYEFLYTISADGGEATRLDTTFSPMGMANVPVPLNTLAESRPVILTGKAWRPPDGMSLIAEAPEFWMFRTDPGKVGEAQQWFAPSMKESPWRVMSTYDFWDKALRTKQRRYYVGDGWYALDLVVPHAHGRKVWLHFGAVDENYTLWINGTYVGDNLAAGTSLWDKPVSVEITGGVKEGQSNHIVVRVRNSAFAGGIWKPVRILAGK